MKKDYLWDKTGSDPAIEKLESALRMFGAAESPMPVFPVETSPAKRSFLARFMPLVFAAASLAIAAVGWGVWIQISAPGVGDAEALIVAPPVDSGPPAPVNKPAPPYIAVSPASKPSEEIEIPKASARASRPRSRTVLRTIPAETRQPKFTAEEVYAYNQLMLALSITSDKLGQVRDKANGE
jgi:hypothetical protein